MSSSSETRLFAEDPVAFFGGSWAAMHAMPSAQLAELQLGAMRMRFRELRDQIPVLKMTADTLRIDGLEMHEDVVPLLFPHTMYKSYPISLVERNRFDGLSRWLERLTIHDLSGVSVSSCDGIDSWLDVLDTETDVRVALSSGSSGSMSFLPRTAQEWTRQFDVLRIALLQLSDSARASDHSDEYFDVIWPTFRSGRTAWGRSADEFVRIMAGCEERFHALHRGRMSADLMFLAGRLRASEVRGDRLGVSDTLRARRGEFEALQRELEQSMPRFFADAVEKLQGRRVFCFAPWTTLYNLAQGGLSRGVKDAFAPDSLIQTGGGAKGQVVPPDWEDVVRRFTGVERIHSAYGMSEVMTMHHMCERERYHIHPSAVLFVLDPENGAPLPRDGVRTGRAAFFDLMANTYWGGFITGDEVSVDWSPCECGLSSVHIARTIERYSDKQSGDDKITCAATGEAHNNALDYLNDALV